MSAPRGEFSSKLGCLSAAAGSAVGLGNIVNFPTTPVEQFVGDWDGNTAGLRELRADLCAVFALAFAGATNATALQLFRMKLEVSVRESASSVRALFAHILE